MGRWEASNRVNKQLFSSIALNIHFYSLRTLENRFVWITYWRNSSKEKRPQKLSQVYSRHGRFSCNGEKWELFEVCDLNELRPSNNKPTPIQFKSRTKNNKQIRKPRAFVFQGWKQVVWDGASLEAHQNNKSSKPRIKYFWFHRRDIQHQHFRKLRRSPHCWTYFG